MGLDPYPDTHANTEALSSLWFQWSEITQLWQLLLSFTHATRAQPPPPLPIYRSWLAPQSLPAAYFLPPC